MMKLSSIQFYLYNAFTNGHCPKVAVQKYIRSVYKYLEHKNFKKYPL